MKIEKASFEILEPLTSRFGESISKKEVLDREKILSIIEKAGRTCYKSEAKGDASSFIRGLIRNGHHSVIEHASMTVKFICDRGVTHELVRHRLASYSQESTRYCNYSKDKFGNEITVIKPPGLSAGEDDEIWIRAMQHAENAYLEMIDTGLSPQIARSVLPNSLRAEIVMTANMREWRHVLTLRTSEKAHPQIRSLMLGLLCILREWLPELFEDIPLPLGEG